MGILFYILSVTFFLESNSFAEDKSYSKSQLKEILKSLDGKIEPSVLNACKEDVESVKVENCKSPSKVMADYVISVAQLNKLRSSVKSYQKNFSLNKHPVQKLQLMAIHDKLECMNDFYKDFTIRCDYTSKTCGRALAFVKYSDIGKKKIIRLCPSYSLKKETYQYNGSVLLHELSHHCGTKDIKYIEYDKPIRLGRKTDSPLRTDISHMNASNFDFWARNGFCLPDFDCKQYKPPFR